MSDLKGFEKALGELSSLLEKSHVPYMIIGGLANAVFSFFFWKKRKEKIIQN